MAGKKKSTKPNENNLRLGIMIFSLFLGVIVGVGIFLWQQSQALNLQYDRVLKNYSSSTSQD